MHSAFRRFLATLVLAGVTAITSPAAATLSPGLHANRTVQVGAVTRTYDLYVPGSYDGSQPYPLVVDFHFLGGTASGWGSTSGFRALADTAQFLVAYPQGISGYWNAGICCPPSPSADDVGFARALVADVTASTPIDAGRVYATGFSMGSAMAQRLACDAADVFAAVAPFAAQLVLPFPDCHPAQPIAVLYTHGLDDVVVPYAGGPTQPFPSISVPAAVDSFRFLAQTNGCCTNCLADPGSEPPTLVDDLGDGDPATRCEAYSTCAGGVAVELCSERMGHSVPAVGPSRAWTFMQSHARGGSTTTTSSTSTTSTTLPAVLCPPSSRNDCSVTTAPTSSALTLVNGATPAKQRLAWRWGKGAWVLPGQFGDPSQSSGYALCLYDGSGLLFYAATVPASASCDGGPCWRGLVNRSGSAGWKFKDRAGRYDGLQNILVKPGSQGKSRAAVKARGADPSSSPFPFPTLPLSSPPTVQLLTGDTCIGAPMTTVVKNLTGKFVAKGGL